MNEFANYITPDELTSIIVFKSLNKHYCCPWCISECTRNNPKPKWVETPLAKKSPNLICDGCAHDIYSACASREFEDPDFSCVVEDAANKERLDVDLFRVICLEHQISITRSKIIEHGDKRFYELLDQLKELRSEL